MHLDVLSSSHTLLAWSDLLRLKYRWCYGHSCQALVSDDAAICVRHAEFAF